MFKILGPLESSDVLSAIALLVSIAAFVYGVVRNRIMTRKEYYRYAESMFIPVEQSMSNCPAILRFFGIHDDIEAEYGITIEELSVLLPLFTAGGLYERTVGESKKDGRPYPLGGYYGRIMSSPDTQRAWPLIRRLLGTSNYSRRLDATLDLALKNAERFGVPADDDKRDDSPSPQAP